ncbi:hypothetical protein U1Q18_037313 [Sarracenia purpurea var. burkii]
MGCSQCSCRVEVMPEGSAQRVWASSFSPSSLWFGEGMADTWGSEAPPIRLSRSAGMAMAIDWVLRPHGATRPSTLTRSLSARLYGFDFFTPPSAVE